MIDLNLFSKLERLEFHGVDTLTLLLSIECPTTPSLRYDIHSSKPFDISYHVKFHNDRYQRE